jgi:hypothetical protein
MESKFFKTLEVIFINELRPGQLATLFLYYLEAGRHEEIV